MVTSRGASTEDLIIKVLRSRSTSYIDLRELTSHPPPPPHITFTPLKIETLVTYLHTIYLPTTDLLLLLYWDHCTSINQFSM